MNHSYKVIWNQSLNCFMAVAEYAKSRGKSSSHVVSSMSSASAAVASGARLLRLSSLTVALAATGMTLSTQVFAFTGDGGTAAGSNAIAIGGTSTTARAGNQGNQSVAIGYDAQVSGDQSVGLGANVRASGNSSIAIGGDDLDSASRTNQNGTLATDLNGGDINTIFKKYSGRDLVDINNRYPSTSSSGTASVAIGVQAVASGGLSTAFGTQTKASGVASSAFGVSASATKEGSVAIGAGSRTDGSASKVQTATVNGVEFTGFVGNASFAGTAADAGRQVSVGLIGNERQIKNVAPGELSATSTDAINGSQIYAVSNKLIDNIKAVKTTSDDKTDALGTSTATNLGGGATYSTTTGSVSAPEYKLNNNATTVNNVGAALTNIDGRTTTNTTSITGLQNQTFKLRVNTDTATAVAAGNTVAFFDGNNVNITRTGNNVTIGTSLKPTFTTVTATDALFTTVTSTGVVNAGSLSVIGASNLYGGADLNNKKITNVANGNVDANSQEAINGRQLLSTAEAVKNVIGGNAVNTAGAVTTTNIGGTNQNNINDAIAVTNTQANSPLTFVGNVLNDTDENGSQQKLGSTINISGGATAASSNANVKTVVTDGKVDIQIANAPTFTGQLKANGFDASSQKIANVLAGTANTDAANVGQVQNAANAVTNSAPVVYTKADGTQVYKVGTQFFDNATGTGTAVAPEDIITSVRNANGSTTTATKLSNVANGTIAKNSTDAVNGDQLFTTNQNVTTNTTALNNINNGAGIKYFHTNSVLSDSQATGTNSIAIGPNSTSSGVDALALGNAAQAKSLNSIALGTGAIANGSVDNNSGTAIAIGRGSRALGNAGNQIALGDGAIAGDLTLSQSNIAIGTGASSTGLESTVIGNSATSSVNEGLALGNGANASIANSVALGARSVTRAATNVTGATIGGTAYKFAGTTPSTAGVVSVGSVGAERQIQNVAAGQLTTTSTDAVNGSQLFATNQQVTTNATNINKGLNFAGDTGTDVNRKLGETLSLKGGETDATKLATGKNIGITTNTTNDGLLVQLAKDVNLGADGSVTTGNTVTNTDGVTITDGKNITAVTSAGTKVTDGTNTSNYGANGITIIDNDPAKDNVTLTKGGLNNGGNRITNVAAGTIAADSTDAVNGDQLNTTNKNVTNNTTAIGDINAGRSGIVRQDAGTGAITVGAQTGGTTVGFTNSKGATRQLTGVSSAGDYKVADNANNAVNASDLNTAVNSVTNAGLSFAGDTGTAVQRKLGETLSLKGGETDATKLATGKNIGITTNTTNDGLLVQLAKDVNLGADGSVTTGNTVTNTKGTTITDGKNITALTAAGTNVTDGTNTSNYGANGLTITDNDPATDNVTLTKGGLNNGGNRITNVAAGTESTDAATFGQVQNVANAVTNSAPVVYTTADGTQVYNTANGFNTAQDGTGTAVDNADIITSVRNANGSTTTATKLSNVANGTVAANSTDAVNGGQLFTTNAAVTDNNNRSTGNLAALGGGAKYDATTDTYTAPSYRLNNGDNNTNTTVYRNVGDALGNLDTRTTTNTSNIANLNNKVNGIDFPIRSSNAKPFTTTATGIDTLAVGSNATARGIRVTAVGEGANASGINVTVFGQNAKADGIAVTAIGQDATTDGINATAIGQNASANSINATAIGQGASANSINATSIGAGASSGFGGFAGGQGANASMNSVALGAQSAASAMGSVAIGNNASATVNGGIALGQDSVASIEGGAVGFAPTATSIADKAAIAATNSTNLGAVSVGTGENGGNRQIVNVAAGTNDSDAVNVAQLTSVANIASQGFNISADNGAADNVQLGETVNFTNTDGNLVATVSDNGINYDLAQNIDLGADGSLKTGNTVTNKDGITITDGKNITAMTSAGTNVTDGTNTSNYGANGFLIRNQKTNTMSLLQEGNFGTFRVDENTGMPTNGSVITPDFVYVGNAQGEGSIVTNDGFGFSDELNSMTPNLSSTSPSIRRTGINAGSTRITNVTDGTELTDAATFGQVQNAANVVANSAPVVYTQVDGTQVYNTANGFNTAQDGTGIAVNNIDIITSVRNANGSTTTATKLSNVANGTIAANSTDAVTGDQLNTTNTNVTNNTSAIGDINAGRSGIVRQDAGTGAITVGAQTGGTTVGIAGIDGVRTLSGLANGDISKGSTQAVTGDQLNATNNAINKGIKFNVDGGERTYALGETIGITTDKNIITSATKEGVNVAINPDLVVDSVTTGNTVTNTDGVSVTNGTNTSNYSANGFTATDSTNTTTFNQTGLSFSDVNGQTGPSITAAGMNAGSKKIINVDNGSIVSGSKDAINGGQLFNTAESVKNVIGGNAVNTGGVVTATNIGGTGATTIDSAIKNVSNAALTAKTTLSEGKNITITTSTNKDGSTDYNVKTQDDLTLTSVKTGNSVLDNAGVTITDGKNITAMTSAGTKVTDGKNTSNYSANGFTATDGTNTTTFNQTGLSFTDGNGATGPSITAGGINANKTVITNVGNAVNAGDAVNKGQLDNLADGSVQYARNIDNSVNYNQVTLAGAQAVIGQDAKGKDFVVSGGTRLSNVANGIDAADAVNKGQLDSLIAHNITNVEVMDQNLKPVTVNVTDQVVNRHSDNGNMDSLFLTYNVEGQNITDRLTIGETVQRMNTEGVKFAHTNAVNAKGNLGVTNDSSAGGKNSTAIGVNAIIQEGADSTVALGHNTEASASATNSVVIGNDSQVAGQSSIAIGDGAQAMGNQSISIGTGNVVNGNNSGAFGDPSIINGANSYSVGNNNTIDSDDTFVLGNNVTSTVEGSVVLGTGSAARTGAGIAGYLAAGNAAITATTSTTGAMAVGDAANGIYRQVTGVAAGTADSDAVNVSQLKAVSDTLQSNNEALSNAAVQYDKNADSTVNKGSITLGGGAAGTTITNVKAGNVSAGSTDAINGSQLHNLGSNVAGIIGGNATLDAAGNLTASNIGGTGRNNINDAIAAVNQGNAQANENIQANTDRLDAGLSFGADSGTTINKPIGHTTALKFEGGNNITTTATSSGIKFDLNGNIDVDNITADTVTTGNTTVNNTGVTIKDGPSMTTAGINAGDKTITGVADGIEVNDAVNLGQLNALDSKLSNSVNELGYKINEVEDDANAGISAAMAMSSLPQAYIPGKSMIGGGIANYNGQSAVAIGVSKVSDNGRWVIKVNGTADTQGNAGGAVGAGFHF